MGALRHLDRDFFGGWFGGLGIENDLLIHR